MRTFFIFVGTASVIYGGYLLWRAKQAEQQPAGNGSLTVSTTTAVPVLSGPTIGNNQSVDNGISMVEQYGQPLDTFPPMTYIGIPAGSNCGAMDTFQPKF